MLLGVATSVVANILHAEPNPISQAIAAWPPLALLLTVELISRVPVHRWWLAVVRVTATVVIAGIAAWVSYWHMAGVAIQYGEEGAAPYLIPVSVDGLVVVASVCLIELSGRIQAAARKTAVELPQPAEPDERADVGRVPQPEAPDKAPDIQPDAEPDTPADTDPVPTPRNRPKRKRSTATAVARLRERHPEMTSVEIARRVGVTDRTVRRHLRTPVLETV